jgi:hypothetical protein
MAVPEYCCALSTFAICGVSFQFRSQPPTYPPIDSSSPTHQHTSFPFVHAAIPNSVFKYLYLRLYTPHFQLPPLLDRSIIQVFHRPSAYPMSSSISIPRRRKKLLDRDQAHSSATPNSMSSSFTPSSFASSSGSPPDHEEGSSRGMSSPATPTAPAMLQTQHRRKSSLLSMSLPHRVYF